MLHLFVNDDNVGVSPTISSRSHCVRLMRAYPGVLIEWNIVLLSTQMVHSVTVAWLRFRSTFALCQ